MLKAMADKTKTNFMRYAYPQALQLFFSEIGAERMGHYKLKKTRAQMWCDSVSVNQVLAVNVT